MERVEWTWNRMVPSIFIVALLFLGFAAAAMFVEFRSDIRMRVNWLLVVLAIVATAGALTAVVGVRYPVGLAVVEDGVLLAYLHRREFLIWPLVLMLEFHVDSSVTIETSLRSISLGIPGDAFVAPLIREMRRRKKRIRTPMPEEYPESEYIGP